MPEIIRFPSSRMSESGVSTVYVLPADLYDRTELYPLAARGAQPGDRILLESDRWYIVRRHVPTDAVVDALAHLLPCEARDD